MIRAVPACALDLIKSFEGLHDGDKRTPHILEPQRDPVGIYTEGWGHALFLNGKPVKDYATAMRLWRARWSNGMTLADADAQLTDTAQEVCDRIVTLLPRVIVNDHELGAMVCLAYNIGVGEVGGAPDFADSTVRRKMLANDKGAAADAFLLWKYSDGKVFDGLVRRRRAERALFLTPITEAGKLAA